MENEPKYKVNCVRFFFFEKNPWNAKEMLNYGEITQIPLPALADLEVGDIMGWLAVCKHSSLLLFTQDAKNLICS